MGPIDPAAWTAAIALPLVRVGHARPGPVLRAPGRDPRPGHDDGHPPHVAALPTVRPPIGRAGARDARIRSTPSRRGITLVSGCVEGTMMSSRKTLTRTVAASVVATVCLMFAAGAGANPPTDPCGVVTELHVAHALRLEHAREESVAVRLPGNSAGVVRDRCKVTVWDGQMPTGRRQEQDKLANREMAILRIESWVPDQGGQVEAWRAEFPAKVKGLTERARAQFLEGPLAGSTISLPKEGVPHALAFAAPAGNLEKARAFWWDRRGTILSINASQGAGRPAIPSLRRLAADLVRPFFKG